MDAQRRYSYIYLVDCHDLFLTLSWPADSCIYLYKYITGWHWIKVTMDHGTGFQKPSNTRSELLELKYTKLARMIY